MTREEKIAALRAAPATPTEPVEMTREQKIEALKGAPRTSINLSNPDPDLLEQGFHYATLPMSYLGGLGRTAVAAATGMNPNTTDWMEALKGNAKSFSEYMKKSGVGEMGKMSDLFPGQYSDNPSSDIINFSEPNFQKGGMLDFTGRGTLGTAVDVASDPLTYVGIGPFKTIFNKAPSLLKAALQPAKTSLTKGGKGLYKSAPIMKAADVLNATRGKIAASDVLFENGIAGTGRGIVDKSERLAEQIGKQRDAILKGADTYVDMNAAMKPAEELVAKIRQLRDPKTQAYADTLEKEIAQYKALNSQPEKLIPGEIITTLSDAPGTGKNLAGYPQTAITTRGPDTVVPAVRGVTPMEASSMKSSIYNETGDAVWDSLRKTPQGQLGNKALARGLNEAISQTGLDAAKVDALNESWGALLTPRKVMESQARIGERKHLFTPVDALTIGATHEPSLLALKKAADMYKTNWFKTHAGKKMYQAGTYLPLDILLREEAAQQNNSTQPIDPEWYKLMRGN